MGGFEFILSPFGRGRKEKKKRARTKLALFRCLCTNREKRSEVEAKQIVLIVHGCMNLNFFFIQLCIIC